MTPTHEQLLDCLAREIAMRRRVYPRMVQEDRMSQRVADEEIACMELLREIVKGRAPIPASQQTVFPL